MAGMVYAVSQGVERQSANDPQIQLARDAAARLAKGETPAAVAAPSGLDIAATLSISHRTADAHVEHILVKLGFTSRTQIAAWVVQRHAS